jgi:2-polyprenyl-3-methyl-5-hydroxy-6-metoxy-1,4-benzoquinol methylase
MNSADYYQRQGEARGIENFHDLQKRSEMYFPVYDRLILPKLSKGNSAVIYEAACGPGMLLYWFKSHRFKNVTASDMAQKEVEIARETGYKVTHDNSIEDIQRYSQKFDAIIAIDFIEHLEKGDFLKFLAVSHAALRPGGILILRAPNGDSPFVGLNLFNDITHVWAYTTTALRALLGLAGFHQICFDDDTVKSLHRWRLLKLPFMILSQMILRGLIRTASRQPVHYLGSSIYIYATKPG